MSPGNEVQGGAFAPFGFLAFNNLSNTCKSKTKFGTVSV
jgi:hypothetical protein